MFSLGPIEMQLSQLVVLLFCLNCESLKKFGPVVSEIWAVEYWYNGYRIYIDIPCITTFLVNFGRFCNFQISASTNSTEFILGSLERQFSILCNRL